MTKYYTLILLLSLTFLSACGQAPALESRQSVLTCPVEPTMCRPSDLYGPECYNYDTYEQMGYDVSEAARKCNLAHIERE